MMYSFLCSVGILLLPLTIVVSTISALSPSIHGSTVSFASPPVVTFNPILSRSLIYDQNPELIYDEDTVDYGNVSHLGIPYFIGKGRLYMELENQCQKCGSSLGYAIVFLNTDLYRTVTGRITVSSFQATENGGEPIAYGYNNYQNQSINIPPRSYLFVYRNDTLVSSLGTIFSGLLEFEVNQTIGIKTLCYAQFSTEWNIWTLNDELYITRQDPNDNESRVYKGLGPLVGDISTLPLVFTVNTSYYATPINSSLPVQYPLYNTTTEMYEDNYSIFNGILLNTNPLSNSTAVSSDMIGSIFTIPGFGPLNPWGCCDGNPVTNPPSISNVANWGTKYHIKGLFYNNNTDDPINNPVRTIHIKLLNQGCVAAIAWTLGSPFTVPSSLWYWKTLWDPGEEIILGSYVINQTNYNVPVPFYLQYILGGPSCGNEYIYFMVE